MAGKRTKPASNGGGQGAFRNRIKEYRNIRAADLVGNPLNWREHPETQKTAMRAVLKEIGIVDALLVRDRQDGTYDIIDGHLRASLMPEDQVPCLVLDVDETEAQKVLLTFDPISGMAESNGQNLQELLRQIEFSDQSLQALMEDIADEAHLFDDEDGTEVQKSQSGESAPKSDQLFPNREYIVVVCEDANEWQEVQNLLDLKQVRRGGYKPGSPFESVGIERVIKAARLLKCWLQYQAKAEQEHAGRT